ncbi:MAG TPA: hypothetical protein VH596_01110 [Terriglobales bacterium]|jgi:hypothetical protein
MHGLILIPILKAIGELIEHVLGWIDIWWTKKFGRSLSGRVFGSDLQTLFPQRPLHYDFHSRSANDNWVE